jgi:hypothetical protein
MPTFSMHTAQGFFRNDSNISLFLSASVTTATLYGSASSFLPKPGLTFRLSLMSPGPSLASGADSPTYLFECLGK